MQGATKDVDLAKTEKTWCFDAFFYLFILGRVILVMIRVKGRDYRSFD
jgi:hypothetical protein